MKNDYFISISDIDKPGLIGTKGFNLHLLSNKGFNMPVTYCVTTEAYNDFVYENNLRTLMQEIVREEEISYKEKSRRLINLIMGGELSIKLQDELRNNDFLRKENIKWAIRSSSNKEDLATASFAGLYDSYLDVKGLEDILTSIKKCWASLWNERAIVYQEKNNIDNMTASMAVIIQEMVNAEYAGVIFTETPASITGQDMTLEYCEGLGERLVSGEITPHSCRIDKSSQIIHHLKVPVIKKFGDNEINNLSSIALKVEKYFGAPQDIEWAFDGKEIYILQTRPISDHLRFKRTSDQIVWTRANIAEVLPHVIMPLTWEVFQATLSNCPGLALGASNDNKHVNDGVKLIQGYAYIRLDRMLDSFCYLPAVTPNIINRVLGVKLPAAVQSYVRPKKPILTLAQGAFILDALNLLPSLSWSVKRLRRMPAAGPEQIEKIMTWTSNCFRLHLKCTAYAIGAFGLLANFLDRWIPLKAESLLPLILIGHENLQTAAQGISLWELAKHVRENPALRVILENDFNWFNGAESLSAVDGGPQFLTMFQDFLDENGARAAGEFELAVPRWREDPSFILSVVHKFLETQEITPDLGVSTMRHRHRKEAISHIKSSLGTLQRRIFMRLLASYSNYTTLRENIKYRLMEGYALLRQIFLKMGSNLADRGVLVNASDVFFLRPSEVLTLNAGKELDRKATELILERKKQHVHWESHVAPELILDGGQEVISPQDDELIGIGCSPGTAEGVARVLADLCEADTLKPGEILVAPYTDPGWTPLFLSCRAVVTEIGGFLSHGATVAREYGIPAVANVTGATTIIRTGDLIRVNGTNGLVTICSQRSINT